jgi:hypothetical protein
MGNVGFTVDTYGPWINIITPENASYYTSESTVNLMVNVQNYTFTDAAWFRSNSGSGWSQNYMLAWNSTDWEAIGTFPTGATCLQVFANDSLGHVSNQTTWFVCRKFSHSVLFDGMYYNWSGLFTGPLFPGPWSGSVNFVHYSGNTFNVSEINNPAGQLAPYTIDNTTRLATGGFFNFSTSVPYYTPYWVFPNLFVGDYVPIKILLEPDTLFQVTAIEIITFNSIQYQCFILNNLTSWAYYEVNTGLLIESHFTYSYNGNNYYYTINLDTSNALPVALPNLVASFTVSSSTINIGESITFSDATTGGTPPYSYEWNFGDGTANVTTQNPTHQFITVGAFNVTLTVTDANGNVCVYRLAVTVKGPDLMGSYIAIIITAVGAVAVGIIVVKTRVKTRAKARVKRSNVRYRRKRKGFWGKIPT